VSLEWLRRFPTTAEGLGGPEHTSRHFASPSRMEGNQNGNKSSRWQIAAVGTRRWFRVQGSTR